MRKCPECGSERPFRSHRTPFDHVVRLFGRRPFRCRSCRKRFYLPASENSSAQAAGRKESRQRRRAASRRVHVVYLAALLTFVVAAFLILQERG